MSKEFSLGHISVNVGGVMIDMVIDSDANCNIIKGIITGPKDIMQVEKIIKTNLCV